MSKPLCLLLAAFLPALAGCMKAPDPSQAPHAAAAPQMASPPGSLTFEMKVPDGWKALAPDQSFYLKKWQIEGGGICTVSFLGPQSPAGKQANLDRWKGQFETAGAGSEEAAPAPLSGAAFPTTTLTLKGTFTATRSIGGGEPREDWMLAGAVIETPAGPVFFKAVGPRSVLEPELDALWKGIAAVEIAPQ